MLVFIQQIGLIGTLLVKKLLKLFFSFSTVNFYLTLSNLVRKITRAPKSLLLENQQNLKKSFDLFLRIIAKEKLKTE